ELVSRPEALAPPDLAFAYGDERSLAHLVLAQPDPGVPLEHLERALRRREHDLAPAPSKPERPGCAAGEGEDAGGARIEPGGRHGAAQPLERTGVATGVGGEGEDRLGVDG